MNVSLRIWILAAAALVVAVVAGGWFVGVQPQLAAAATTTQSAAGVETQNRATTMKIAALTKAAAKVDSMRTENEVLLKAVPTILKPNTFIRRISEVAALDGVQVKIVSPDTAAPYTAPASTTAAGSAAAGSGVPAPVLAKTDPLITPADFTVVPVTTTVTGSADAVLQFTHDIQNDERTFAVNGLQLAKDDKSSTVTALLTGDIYTLKR